MRKRWTQYCLGVVLHDLAGAATALEVELEEDDFAAGGDAEAVVDDQHFDDQAKWRWCYHQLFTIQ